MTSCPTSDQLSDLLADSVTDAERDELEEHLEQCANCQSELERLSLDATELEGLQRRLVADNLSWPTGTYDSFGRSDKTTWPTIPGYEILGLLGQGGMGVVYRALQTNLGRLVALKMLRSGWENEPEVRRRFFLEARALAQLQHPNIVRIYEIFEQDDRPILALELVEGFSLATWLREATVSPNQSARLVEILARAVHHTHELGILHRDLKPSNVLLQFVPDTTGEIPSLDVLPADAIKITDFGLARQADNASETRTGAVLGTPSYMPPEQAVASEGWSSPAVDVYSLGAMFYETLTGSPPFTGSSTFDILQKVVDEEVVAPSNLQPSVPRDLEAICLTCLNKDPTKRYASCYELAEDLRRFQAGEPVSVHAPTWWTRLQKRVRRHPVVSALLGLVSLILIVLLVIWVRFTRDLQQANADLQVQTQRALANEEKATLGEQTALIQQRASLIQITQLETQLWKQYREMVDDPELKKPESAALRKRLLLSMVESIEELVTRYSFHPEFYERQAQAHWWLGSAFAEFDLPQRAEYHFQRAVNVREGWERMEQRDPAYSKELGQYLLAHGRHLFRLRELEAAEPPLLRAKVIFENLDDRQLLADAEEGLQRIAEEKMP